MYDVEWKKEVVDLVLYYKYIGAVFLYNAFTTVLRIVLLILLSL